MTQAAKPQEPVLVVEDTDDSREMLGTLLESEGYRVAYAVDGRDALEQLQGGLRPCLILLDVAMPRMNGIEFRRAQAADERFSDIPVILYSALHEITWLYPPSATERDPVLDVPVCRKPVDVDHILQMVARCCAHAEVAPPH